MAAFQGRGWARRAVAANRLLLAMTLLMLAGAATLSAQGGAGGIAGRLTDLYSRPLPRTAVTLREIRSGRETHGVTEKDGRYRFAGLAPGEYLLEAEDASGGYGRLGGILVTAGHESRIQAALALAPRRADEAAVRRTHEGSQPFAPEPARTDREVRNSGPAQDEHPAATVATDNTVMPDSANQIVQPGVVGSGPQLVERSPVAASAVMASSDPGTQPIVRAASAGTLVAVSAAHRQTGFALASICGLQAQLTAVLPAARNIELAEFAAAPPARLHTEDLQQLPLPGRNWGSLVADQPARSTEVLEEDAGGKGSRPEQGSSLTVDGSETGLAFGERRSGRNSVGAIADSSRGDSQIREVTLLAASATAPHMEVVTAKGGPVLHGQASVIDRENMWGAKNPYTVWVKEVGTTGGEFPTFADSPYTAGDRDLTWSASAGSRIPKSALFLFGSVNGRHTDNPSVATVKHPENFFAQPAPDEMRVLSARLGLSDADPVGEGAAAYAGMLRQLAGLLGPAPRSSQEWSGIARVDWEGRERFKLTVEGVGALWDAPGGGLRRASEPYGAHSFGSDHAMQTWISTRAQAFVTPNLLLSTEVSAGRHILSNRPEQASPFEDQLLASAWGHLPQMTVDSRNGFTIGNPARFGTGSYPDEHAYGAKQMVDWVHGGLLLRSGVDFRHDMDATGFVRNHLGTFSYARVENFISDALVFSKFGLTNGLDPANQHQCDQRGRAWRDTSGGLHGLGYLPCYSYYTQTMGPTDWFLSTNRWAAFTTAEWKPARQFVVSAGLRWQREQMPPPIARAANPDLPQAGRAAATGNEWAPRLSLAWGTTESPIPVIRVGYGMYFGLTRNAVLEQVLTQTGASGGDLHFFLRPMDNLQMGGAPPFPYVLGGPPSTVVKPGAVEMASGFRNPEVHQGEFSLAESLPGKIEITASAAISLGRFLPVTRDINLDPTTNPGTITYQVTDATGKGPLHGQVKVPFFAVWPGASSGGRAQAGYQQIARLESRANSTYEAATLRLTRSSRHGLRVNARYTYAHAADWNPNETAQIAGSSMLDPSNLALEYGASDLDVRHSASASVIWQMPAKLKGWRAVGAGWTFSGIGHMRGGLPYTMRTGGYLAQEFVDGRDIVALGTGMNGSGGDNRVYGVGRNTFRYPMTWKTDLRVSKQFVLGRMRDVQLFAESFNLFNHQNVTLLETTGYTIVPGGAAADLPELDYLTGHKSGQTEFGKPLDVNATDFFKPRQIDFGMRMRW